MAIFNSYVSLPESKPFSATILLGWTPSTRRETVPIFSFARSWSWEFALSRKPVPLFRRGQWTGRGFTPIWRINHVWVCLKMVYQCIPRSNGHLMGKLVTINWIWGYPIFRQTLFVVYTGMLNIKWWMEWINICLCTVFFFMIYHVHEFNGWFDIE